MSNELAPYRETMPSEFKATEKAVHWIRDKFQIITDDDYAFAVDLCKEAKTRFKQLDEARKKLTVPMNAALKEANALFRPTMDRLELIGDGILKTKMSEFVASKRVERVEAMNVSVELANQGITPTNIIPAPPEAEGVTYIERWDFEIVNAEAVPFAYQSPDPEKIKRAMKLDVETFNEPRKIDGIRFFIATDVRVKT